MGFKLHAFTAGSFRSAAIALSATSFVLAGCAKGPDLAVNSDSPAPIIGTPATGATAPAGGAPGPVRMARVSYETGKVSWRPDGTTAWSPAVVNMPMRQGAEAWLAPGSRLEIQFDDGSTMRLGDGAVATLQTLYSDNQGEFTEVKLNAGTASCNLKNKYSIYQVDAPCDSVKSVGPGDFRVDVKAAACSCAVRKGNATITAGGVDTPVLAGQYTMQQGSDDPVHIHSLGPKDPEDHFNDNRDALLSEAPTHVPENIALVSGGLDRQGDWHDVAGDGWVWSPRVEPGWRPYHHGHWSWVDPYGWTWVSNESWGWAPYHYGTWERFGFGWGWAPGPAVQYWSPARVDFTESNGYVTWAPFAPSEVVYPEFAVGFGGGNWWATFSIGGAGVYEPYGPGICQPYPYPYGYGDPGWRQRGWEPGGWGQGNFASNPYHFVPRNSAFGAVGVSIGGFSANVEFAAISGNASNRFRTGSQAVAYRQAFSGPVNIHPNRTAFTPSHAFTSNAQPAAFNRALVRGNVPANIARTSGSFGPAAQMSGMRGVAASRPANRGGVSGTPANVAAARSAVAFRGRTGLVAPRSAATSRVAGRTVTEGARVPGSSIRTRTTRARAVASTRLKPTRAVTRQTSVRTQSSRPSTRGSVARTQTRSVPRVTRSTSTAGAPRQSSGRNRGGGMPPSNRGGGSRGGPPAKKGGGGGRDDRKGG